PQQATRCIVPKPTTFCVAPRKENCRGGCRTPSSAGHLEDLHMLDSVASPAQDIRELLRLLAEKGGSDMFLSTGALPHAKIDGLTQPISGQRLTPGVVRQMAYQLMNE